MVNKKFIYVLMFIFMGLLLVSPVLAAHHNIDTTTYSCGNKMIENIPQALPKAIHLIYNICQIAVPVLLVVFGSLDLLKALAAQKEDEIKKGQSLVIKRLIAAVILFFVFAIVKILISVVSDTPNTANNIVDCAECFINNDCTREN